MFGYKAKKLNEELVKKLTLMETEVSNQNELYRALYDMIASGMPLGKDSKLKEYVKEGYEGNPDLFSIVTKLGGMFAAVPLVPYKMIGDKKERVDMPNEIQDLFDNINYFQTFYEFKNNWAIARYITGNAIVYAPRFTAGINKGKLTNDGLIVMPAQDTTIKSGGWRQPVKYYTLDINETYKIDVVDIWHERFAPTLNYEEGKNFMGMSPVKVARNLLNSQNKGYEIASKLYAYGHPPGILSKETDAGGDQVPLAEQESKFRERYKRKYAGINNMAIPIFTLGKLNYTKIGFDSLKELNIISMSEHGRRVFCNILQTPAQLFNDTASSTYNNMLEASKAIYVNRILPDLNVFCQGINRIMKFYDGIELQPDISSIDALQEDKTKRVEWASKMFNDSVITGDQYLEMIGEEPTGLPEMQIRFTNLNRIPLNEVLAINEDLPSIQDSDKFYLSRNLENAM